MIWGGDLYNPIKFDKPMRYLTGFVDAIHTLATGDIKLFKDVYGEKQTHALGYLYPGLYGEKVPVIQKQETPLIIVGNSGDEANNHVEILQLLSKKSDIKDYKILLPVSYNFTSEYEAELLVHINKLGLEDITTLQKDFVSPEEYVKTMTSASIFIGAHNRQQAVGNILGSIYGGNKTLLRKNITIQGKSRENPGWTLLKEYGFEIQDYDLLKSVNALKDLPEVSDEQRTRQQQIIHNEFGIENRSSQLIESSRLILEKIRSTQPVLQESE